jgi:hypothetical protein
MSQDYVTQLRLQLREAALREERRAPVARQIVLARRRLPGPAPVAAGLAATVLAVVVALGAGALRGEPEPAKPKVVGTYVVSSGLAPLSAGFGAVWTADPIRGEVVRLDPGRHGVAARIPVGGDAVVATGAGAVWALAGDLLYAGDQGPVRLLRIDPARNRVVARIPMRTPAGEPFGPLELQVARGVVWVVGAAGALRIDPARNVPDRFVRLGDERGVVTDGDSVWVLTLGGRLRELDARTGRAVGEVRVPAVPDPGAHLFWGRPGTLTLVTANRIAVLERANGRRLWETALEGDVRHWVADDGALWVHVERAPAAPDRLVRLDAGSGRRTGEVDLPEPGVTGMAVVGGELWVATPGGKLVVVRR